MPSKLGSSSEPMGSRSSQMRCMTAARENTPESGGGTNNSNAGSRRVFGLTETPGGGANMVLGQAPTRQSVLASGVLGESTGLGTSPRWQQIINPNTQIQQSIRRAEGWRVPQPHQHAESRLHPVSLPRVHGPTRRRHDPVSHPLSACPLSVSALCQRSARRSGGKQRKKWFSPTFRPSSVMKRSNFKFGIIFREIPTKITGQPSVHHVVGEAGRREDTCFYCKGLRCCRRIHALGIVATPHNTHTYARLEETQATRRWTETGTTTWTASSWAAMTGQACTSTEIPRGVIAVKAATRAILLFAALSLCVATSTLYVGRTQNIGIYSDRCPLLHCYKHSK